MQLHCFKRCARVLCLVVIIARAVPCLDAQAYTLPERGSHGRDQPDRKLTVTDRSGDLLDLSFAFGSLNHTLQGCPYLPSVLGAEGSKGCYHANSGCLINTCNSTESAFALEAGECELLPESLLPAASQGLQSLHCLRSCVSQVAVILHADDPVSTGLRANGTNTDASTGYLHSVCSRLASVGLCASTVLQTTAALLSALCQQERAALLSALPQACKDAGHALPAPYSDNTSEQLLFTRGNCPPEANTLSCSRSHHASHRCPSGGCDILCALGGDRPKSLISATVYSNKAVSQASAGRATVVSVTVLGVFLVLMLLFLGWKMRQYWLCPCCLPEPDELSAMEANNLLDVAQAMHSTTHGGLPGSRAVPEHAVKKGFDHLLSYIAAKLAGYKKAKKHKARRGGSRAGSPRRATISPRGSGSPKGIQMTSQSKAEDRQRRKGKGKGKGHKQWEEDPSLDNSMHRSDSNEVLIGVAPDQLDPELMQSDPQDDMYPHSSASSVSLDLTEQYSIASCSYPPLDMSNLQQFGDGVLLSAEASSQDLEGTLYAEQSSV